MELRNRVVMAPTATRYPTSAGHVTQRLIDYYVPRAQGGAGLIIVQFTAVSPNGRSSLWPLGIWDDRFIPGLCRLADAIHVNGARTAIQIAHAGCQTRTEYIGGDQPVSPSAIPRPNGEIPRELTVPEIYALMDDFAQAARRAADAGFDAVEIHMAHGYLINQFLSPLSNRRADEFGGPLENRIRFAVGVLKRVIDATRGKVAILCRISADEFVKGGQGLEETSRIARALERKGAQAIHVSAGIGPSTHFTSPWMAMPEGALLPLAAGIKSAVRIPVIAVGKIRDPERAERALEEGKADLIAFGRALIADPDFPNKASSGRAHEIRPCLACLQPACQGRIFSQLDMACVVNPRAGREADTVSELTPTPKRIVVIGAGPGGLEAARVAAERGHSVVVYEREPMPGGQFKLVENLPHREVYSQYVRSQVSAITKAGGKIMLNALFDPSLLDAERPDTVIVATGANALVPDIPGVRENCVTAWSVLSSAEGIGERVAIIGAGDVGCETAAYLASRGSSVTILEMLDRPLPDIATWLRAPFVQLLNQLDVNIITNARVACVNPAEVVYERAGLEARLRPVDTIVLAVGSVSDSHLVNELRRLHPDVRAIGDCATPRTAFEAIREGHDVGLAL